MRVQAALITAVLCGCGALTPASMNQGVQGLRLVHPGASRVQVVADWNLWGGAEGAAARFEPWVDEMVETAPGEWTGAIPNDLPRGRYRYAFLVDGHRILPDPLCPDISVWNGHAVSLLVVR